MRHAIFVDAGRLLAAAALEVTGDRGRDAMACEHRGLLAARETVGHL